MDRPPIQMPTRARLRVRNRQGLMVCGLVLLWLLSGLFVRAEPHGFAWYAVLLGPLFIVLIVIIAPIIIHRLRSWRENMRAPSGTRRV
jgi:hypothetical protein